PNAQKQYRLPWPSVVVADYLRNPERARCKHISLRGGSRHSASLGRHPSNRLPISGLDGRNLFSPGELGWQDWRDVVAMGLGSGIAWGTLATAFLGGWRAVRRRGTAGSAA